MSLGNLKLNGSLFLVGFTAGALVACGTYWLRKRYIWLPRYQSSRCKRCNANQCMCEIVDYKCCQKCGRINPSYIICGHGEDVVDGI